MRKGISIVTVRRWHYTLALILLLAACSSTQTQTGLRLGDRVRITPPDAAEERFGGSYQDARDESLVVVEEGDTITIPISGIELDT